jgi:hypothetical protein
MSKSFSRALVFMVIVAAWFIGSSASHAIDLRDLQITIQTNLRSESQNMLDGSAPTVVSFANEGFIDAVGGNIVWFATNEGCMEDGLSVVYSPRGPQSANIGCKPVRKGTASCWREESSQARYTSQMSIAGDVVTLTGQMTGTARIQAESPTLGSSDNVKFSITQKLRLRIVGQTCQVLEFSTEDREESIGQLRGRSGVTRPTHTTKIQRVTAGAGAKCTVARRSDIQSQPDSDDLQLPDLQCGDH